VRIGLLECDHVDERYRGVVGDYRDEFERLLGTEVVPFDVVAGEVPVSPTGCDAWVCSGSRHSVYDDAPWIDAASAFVAEVHEAGTPFVGICFGHQLLAAALGGTVERAGSGWGAGVRRIDVIADEPWMDPRRPAVALHFMHQDQVSEVPDGGVVLGRTDHCEVAAFRVDRMLGVQAHPEFTAAYVEALLVDRADRIGDEATAAARASLATPTDEDVVARWLVRFLAGDTGG
jgi:GMP synthase-like glutamine amidotransferase